MSQSASAVITRQGDPKSQYEAIAALVDAKREQIIQTLPATIPPERFISVALQAVTRQPRLLECTPASIVKALRDAAELGLEPSGLVGSAYLVPYRNSKTRQYEAQLIPGYRGLIDLARRSAELRKIEAKVVRERDDFDFEYGTGQFLRHKPYLNLTGEVDDDGKALDGGRYVAAYSFAVLATGDEQFEVMTAAEIDVIRRRSKAADNGPWVTDTAEMMRKTPTRRLLKYLPLSATALTRALEMEDAAEGQAISVAAAAPARRALTASLGLSEPEGSTESGEDEEEASQDPEEAQDPLCSIPHPEEPDVLCAKDRGHEGPHTEDRGEYLWPQEGDEE